MYPSLTSRPGDDSRSRYRYTRRVYVVLCSCLDFGRGPRARVGQYSRGYRLDCRVWKTCQLAIFRWVLAGLSYAKKGGYDNKAENCGESLISPHACKSLCIAHLMSVGIRWAGVVSRTSRAHQARARISLLWSLHLLHVDHTSPLIRARTPFRRMGRIILWAEMFICGNSHR
jgi:hypothetical protein